MDEPLLSEVMAYVQEELGPAERAAFEARLAREPELEQTLRDVTDGLAAMALGDALPAAPLTHDERTAIAAIVTTESRASVAVIKPARATWARYVWPAAAIGLLGLNVWQWLLREPVYDGRPTGPAGHGLTAAAGTPPATPATAVLLTDSPMPRRSAVAPAAVIFFNQTLTLRVEPGPRTGASRPASARPSALAGFDTARRQGILDMHLLPRVAPDQILELWVRRADARRFEAVGAIPAQYYGGSGAITYQLPSLTTAPAELLVTIEQKSGPGARPSAAVVLHGP